MKQKKVINGTWHVTEDGGKNWIDTGIKADVNYDVYSPETMKAAEDKGYTISKIDPSVQYTETKIGTQRKWDPESGFYYDPIKAVPPGKAGLDHYMKLHEDIIAEYPGGADQWKKDHLTLANKKDAKGRFGRGDKAIEHVVKNVNTRYKEATGKDLIDFNKPDALVPGVQLFNLPGISKKKEPEPGKEPVPGKTQDVTLPPKKDPVTAGPIKENPIVPQLRGKEKAPWWLQDIIQTAGAAGDLARIKRYPPWQATPQFRLPDATFYDPTRELAANAEQANMAYQAQTAFTNPQQLAAASSVTQGQAAKNAADVMGRYNNLNVGLANQLSQERTNIMNTASQNKANLDTQLWDKYTIMNQQFDNSKAQARQNLRNSYISAISNRANTANLNSLYPQYAVDPSTGGFAYFKGNNSKLPATNKSDYIDSLWEKSKKYSPDDPYKMMNILLKGKGSDSESDDEDYADPYQKWKGTS